MLQYALLHLFGYGVSMDDLKAFRVRTTATPEILGPGFTTNVFGLTERG